VGLVAVGVVISDSVESLVGLHHLGRDFLFFGVWSIDLRGGFKLTHHQKVSEVYYCPYKSLTKQRTLTLFRINT
jgi:hypothetical protein